MNRSKKQMYVSPATQRTLVALESGLCAASDVSIVPKEKPNVEVDEYVSVENDVTFE